VGSTVQYARVPPHPNCPQNVETLLTVTVFVGEDIDIKLRFRGDRASSSLLLLDEGIDR